MVIDRKAGGPFLKSEYVERKEINGKKLMLLRCPYEKQKYMSLNMVHMIDKSRGRKCERPICDGTKEGITMEGK